MNEEKCHDCVKCENYKHQNGINFDFGQCYDSVQKYGCMVMVPRRIKHEVSCKEYKSF